MLSLEVEVSARPLGNPKMSQVHQIRGAIQVNLQSPFQRPAYTVEKELVGLGSSTRAASGDFERRVLLELEEIFAAIRNVL